MGRYASLFDEKAVVPRENDNKDMSDPRAADHWPAALRLPDDSHLWDRLLNLAAQEDELFAQNLRCFRIQGTKIITNTDGSYRLAPVIDPTGVGGDQGWESEKVYRDYADRYIGPKVELLRKLLARLAA